MRCIMASVVSCGTNLGMNPPPRGDIQAKTPVLRWKSYIKLWHTRKKNTIKRLQILPKRPKKGVPGPFGGGG